MGGLVGRRARFPFVAAPAGSGTSFDGGVGVEVERFAVFLVDGGRRLVTFVCRACRRGEVAFAVAASV